ncbi:hypothetical protein [Aeromicrobium sp. PE09-221]|uniref:hypothetical protein n=1 Tax=Aeromicrobium sp. PE09-221 TaxID=1898043 RepID=UPI0014833088|nr:hypothetical protein [Aeromicrobium sp. PE09-221]
MERMDVSTALRRWELFGGSWRVLDDGEHSGEMVIALLRCDGGEQVDELRCPPQRL